MKRARREESESSSFVKVSIEHKMADSAGATCSGEKKYRPLKDQAEQLKKAIRMTCTGTLKEAEKECKDMEEEVKKLCKAQQRTPEYFESLHLVFLEEAGKCAVGIKI